jgi:hypothetical protein
MNGVKRHFIGVAATVYAVLVLKAGESAAE